LNYVLITLMLVNALAYIDRAILQVLNQPIKHELGFTDTQLGLLNGFAFMLVYIFCALPIARVSERSSRVTVVTLCISFWSIMTALGGMAMSFWHLLLCRVGVGAGESGAAPAAHSLIGDYFPPERRGSAISIFVLGNPIGILLGSVIGGLVALHFSWRIAFFVVGIPGLLLALLVFLTIREPKRGGAERLDLSGSKAPSLKEAGRHLLARHSFIHMTLGFSFTGITVTAVTAFLAALLIRRFDFDVAHAGMFAGLLGGGASIVGTLLGGFLTDALSKRDTRWLGWLPALSLLVAGPTFALAIAQNDWRWLVGLMVIPFVAKAIHYAPVLAAIHNMTEPRMRATAVTISFMVANTLGAGGGPFVAGILSDLFSSGHFPGSYSAVCPAGSALTSTWCISASAYGLTAATMCASLFGLWAALHFYFASRTLRKDIL
jgi:predicted MFS family arabinose efflux permease